MMASGTLINALIFIWIVVVLLALSAVGALLWAVGNGQFGKIQDAATSIFDADEPIGQPTDHFPRKEQR